MHGADKPQEDGRLLIRVSYGTYLPGNRYYAAIGYSRGAVHDVRSWDNQPAPLCSGGGLQAPLPHPRDWIHARNCPSQPMAIRAHDAWLDGQPGSSDDGWIRSRGGSPDCVLDDFRMAGYLTRTDSHHHCSVLPDFYAAYHLRIQRPP